MQFFRKIFFPYFTTPTVFIILQFITDVALVIHRVALNSTVSTNGVAYSGQVVVFTCITRDSLILEWYSNEYIGTGGDRLQLLSVNCVGANMTGATQGTSATCLRVSEENGETMIVSQLHVRASIRIPTSTVTCTNNGHGSSDSIRFQTEALPNEDVSLNSTLSNGVVAYPQQKLVFTCITRGSLILEWYSDEYIGRNGDRLQLLSVNCMGANITSDNSDASATCLSVFNVNGTVIVSELHVTASLQHPRSTVSCTNNGFGSRRVVSFQTASVTSVEDEHDETDASPGTFTTEERLKLEETTSTVTMSVQSAGNDVHKDSKMLEIVLPVVIAAIIVMIVLTTVILLLLRYITKRQASKKKNVEAWDFPVDKGSGKICSRPVAPTTEEDKQVQDSPVDSDEESPVHVSQRTPENSDDEVSVASSTPLTESKRQKSRVDGKKNLIHNLSPTSKTMKTCSDTSQARVETKEQRDLRELVC